VVSSYRGSCLHESVGFIRIRRFLLGCVCVRRSLLVGMLFPWSDRNGVVEAGLAVASLLPMVTVLASRAGVGRVHQRASFKVRRGRKPTNSFCRNTSRSPFDWLSSVELRKSTFDPIGSDGLVLEYGFFVMFTCVCNLILEYFIFRAKI